MEERLLDKRTEDILLILKDGMGKKGLVILNKY